MASKQIIFVFKLKSKVKMHIYCSLAIEVLLLIISVSCPWRYCNITFSNGNQKHCSVISNTEKVLQSLQYCVFTCAT